MAAIETATPGILVLIGAIVAPVIYYIRAARKGTELYVRRIAGIDAIEEACGRAAELGRPTVFTSGITGLGPVLYACLGVLHFVAKKAAQYKTKLLLPQNSPEVMFLLA